jgi:cyclic-di-GMP-binding protein
MVKREVPLKALTDGEIHPAAKGHVRQAVNITTGIADDKAKELNKFIKASGAKVQTQIQGAQIRVTGKSKDDLQTVIREVKAKDFGIALQFTNYRP